MAERYYWLKLKRDFFKRHDIRIIESMPNGKDYILFYLKLLCESIDHEGRLRFSESVPYNEQMLSVITDTNADIVRSAVKIFTDLGMMELMDNGTYYMHEVESMIGSAANNDNANRQRRFREKKKQAALLNVTQDVTEDNESKSKSKRESKNKSIPPIEEREEINIQPPSNPIAPECEATQHVEYDPLTAYTTKMLGPNPLMLDRMLSYRDSLQDDIIRYAVDESLKLEANKRYNYAIKVCERIVEEGLSTLEQVKAAAEAHKREKSRPRIIRDDDYYDNSGELQ